MIRAAARASVIVLVACTSSTPDPAPSPSAKPPIADAAPSPVAKPPIAKTPAKRDCHVRIADYLTQRAALARCEVDSDCAEMWPGLCPQGPYYVHRETDVAAVIELERAITASCPIPDCEPPMELGIARCEAGTCTKGRAPAPASCWDFRETNLEADGSAGAQTVAKIASTTPQIVIAPAEAGKLVLVLDWPTSCADCRLQISEHNSGMARSIAPARSSTTAERNGEPVRRERLELPVTPGPYHMIATSTAPVDYVLGAELTTTSGAPAKVTRHGIGWQRVCED